VERNSPEGGFMAVELLDRLIEDGIDEVKEAYDEGSPKLEGALEGFELARALPATYEDFAWVVAQREEEEGRMRKAMRSDRTEEAERVYKHHRWATLQLEYCRNILLVAEVSSGRPLPPGVSMSARAAMRYAVIVGVAENTNRQ
jgi:hypothetical protein